MTAEIEQKRVKPWVLPTIGGIAMAALCAFEILVSGMTPNAYAYIALMALSLLRLFHDLSRTTFGLWAQRYLEWAMVLFIALPFVSLVVPRFNNFPLFAHVDVEAKAMGSSDTVSVHQISRGQRFVVVEATLIPRMLADIGNLYDWDFLLQAGGANLDVSDAADEVPNPCSDTNLRRFAIVRCNLVFEVPEGVRSGRLIYDEYDHEVTSEEFLFGTSQAPLPHIDIEVLDVHRVSRIARAYGERAKDGQEFLYVDLRLESVLEPRPFEPDIVSLQGTGWEVYDESADEGVRDPCSEVVLDGTVTCTALFEVPDDATDLRLIVLEYDRQGGSLVDVAGVVDLRLGS